MINQRKPSANQPESELEALYRAHGNAEPDSGLDRIIRARAEQALERSRKRRPAPWIAGLATAGALVLAIGIVVQQSPTPSSSPFTPMMEADAPAPMIHEEAVPAMRAAPRSAEHVSDRARASAPAAEITIDSAAFVVGLSEPPPGAIITEIRALLADGQLDRAQALLQELLAREPTLELPDDLAPLRAETDDAEPEER